MSGLKARESWDIERLVTWALRDQGLGWVGREREQFGFEDYGTVIDDDGHGSHPTIGLLSDDDASYVKAAIDELAPEARVLLVQYGRAGLRPDWCEEGYGSYQQLRYGKRLMWEWSDPVNRTGEKRPKMGFVGEQRETVDFMRAQYRVWWQGLTDIVGPLNNVMVRHRATGPEAEKAPWLSDSAKPVVFGPDGKPLAQVVHKPKVSVEAVETLRARASAPIMARASDWETPAKPIRRRGAR